MKKRKYNMIKIDKKERDWLVNNGVRIGGEGISRTYSNYKHYYLCESKFNMAMHKKYLDTHIIK